jgi:hypothetical protein
MGLLAEESLIVQRLGKLGRKKNPAFLLNLAPPAAEQTSETDPAPPGDRKTIS